jgi:hypothetical protein
MENINLRQEEVTKRIQNEIGSLIVQLTMKGVEIEELRAENAMLMQQLDVMRAATTRPESGQHKVKENGNGN